MEQAITPREWEIIDLVSVGLSNKQVGRQLGLQEGTVKVHLHNIYTKLGVSNRTTLVCWRWRAPTGAPLRSDVVIEPMATVLAPVGAAGV